MSSSVPVTVPPQSAAPFNPASHPAAAPSPEVSSLPPETSPQPEEEGGFCRGEIRTLDESGGLGPLFPGRNRHKSRHSALAYSVLPGPWMNAMFQPELRIRENRNEAGTGRIGNSGTGWHAEEQPGFRDGLRNLAPDANESTRTLALRPAESLERSYTSRAADCLAARTPKRSSQAARPLRGSVLIPVAMLATLTLLGYVAAVQSITAFRSAWHDTDTQIVSEDARAQALYHAEKGQIPGPFAWSPK